MQTHIPSARLPKMKPRKKGRHAQLMLAASLTMMVAPSSLKATDIVWEPDDEQWFDSGNWNPGQVPGAGDKATVNYNPNLQSFHTANLHAPDPEAEAEYFTSSIIRDGQHYRLYRLGSLVAANGQGPLTAPVMNLNLSGSRTENGILYGFALSSGPVSVGKNTFDGYVQFSGGLWQSASLVVGDQAKGLYKQNGGTLLTGPLVVSDGKCDINSFAKVTADSMVVSSGAALADISGSTLTINNAFNCRYGGTFQTDGSQIDIGATLPATSFSFDNDQDGVFTQDGSYITVHGQARMDGSQRVGGQGYFKAEGATVDNHPESSRFLAITDTATADLGALTIGTNYATGSRVDVTKTGKLLATSILMGRGYAYETPASYATSTLNIGAQAIVEETVTLGAASAPPAGTGAATIYGLPSVAAVRGTGTLEAAGISVSQSDTGTGLLQTFTGGKVSVSGDLNVGDGPAASGRIESYDTGSEIAGNKIWIGKNPGSKGVAVAANDGGLRAPDTVILGSLTGTSDATLQIGGKALDGSYFGPGPVTSPSILRAGSTAIDTRVIFQHGAAAYRFTPRLQYVDLVSSTGPGRTTLAGRVWDTGAVQAALGTLEMTYNSVPNTTGYLVAQTGGSVEISGCTVKTPDVAFARTLIGAIGHGTVSVLNGGRLESSILMTTAGSASTSATLNVEGPGSTVLVQGLPLNVGSGKLANLNISGGGKVINNDTAHRTEAILGETVTGIGNATVSGTGSGWDVGTLTMADSGRSTVTVRNGGVLAATNLTLGNATGSSSDLYVDAGGNVTVAASTLLAGNAGSGHIQLYNGGQLKIGTNGGGDLVLRNQSSGAGLLDIGAGTATPGTLTARSVYSGTPGAGATVKISHQAPGYVFTPTLNELDLKIGSGNTGTTSFTAAGNFLSSCSVTSGGMRLAGGGGADMDGEMVVGDGGTVDLDDYTLPFLEIDGATSHLNATSGLLVGKVGDGEVRLKNGGTLKVRDNTRQAADSVILGDDATSYGRSCAVVFGGSATTAPGVLDALGIQSYATTGKVIFNHSSGSFTLPAALGGSLAVQNLAGTTLLTGGLGYSGTTSVTGGTLLITGSTSSAVTVGGGATFGGKGTVARVNLQSGSTLSPGTFRSGDAIASQRITALNFFGGSKVQIDLGPNRTADKILNHNAGGGATTFFPVTSGNITFDFRNAGMNGNGVYPLMTTTDPIPANFMNRLLFTANFPLQGTFQQTRITSDPGSANAYSQLEFVVTSYGARSAYEIWATDTYGLDLATTGAVDADPDHDGLQNMLEFVLGSSPVSGMSSRLPVGTLSNGALKFSFNRRLLLQGYFTTAVEYSTDLVNWTTAPASLQTIGAADDDGLEPVTYTIPLPVGASRLFGRLRVTQVTP